MASDSIFAALASVRAADRQSPPDGGEIYQLYASESANACCVVF
jgi:hypothetical protein